MNIFLKKIRRWIEVALCKHTWIETYYFDPDSEYRYICTKCGEYK